MTTTPKITIAIDGHSSSGKSTMARRLAATIGYRYIDSGAMYRAVTLWAMQHRLVGDNIPLDQEALTAALPHIHIDFTINPDGTQSTILNGTNVERQIRTIDVSNHVSPVAALPAVRHHLVALQQALGAGGGIVMDGRDIGTTVFPDAQMKVFVTASPQVRARRRVDELAAKGIPADYDQVLANVNNRDHIDTTRAESPLRQTPDAILLDNSHMTPDQQDSRLLEIFNNITGNK